MNHKNISHSHKYLYDVCTVACILYSTKYETLCSHTGNVFMFLMGTDLINATYNNVSNMKNL